MKLNLTRWREALLRFETELKHLKKQTREHRGPGATFDTAPLLLCKAEVTRLYCLRRHLKGKLHAKGHVRCVRLDFAGRVCSQAYSVSDLATQEALVRSIDGWMESLLLAEPVAPEAVKATTG